MVVGILVVLFCLMLCWLVKFYKSIRARKHNESEKKHAEHVARSSQVPLSNIDSKNIDPIAIASGSGTPGGYNAFEEQHIDDIINSHRENQNNQRTQSTDQNHEHSAQTPRADRPDSYSGKFSCNEKGQLVQEQMRQENKYGEGTSDINAHHEVEDPDVDCGRKNVDNDDGLAQGLHDNVFVGSEEAIMDDIIKHVETAGQS